MADKKYRTVYRLYHVAYGTRTQVRCITESTDKESLEAVLKQLVLCLRGPVAHDKNKAHAGNDLFIAEFKEEVEPLDGLARALKVVMGELDRIQAEPGMAAVSRELATERKT